MNGAWSLSELDIHPDAPSPIVVPPIRRELRCLRRSPDRFTCTRRHGHTGRHAAILIDNGEVFAVWPEPEPTA